MCAIFHRIVSPGDHAAGPTNKNWNQIVLQVLVYLRDDEGGATAIEYGLIAALVSVAGISAMTALGVSLESLFTLVIAQIDEARCIEVGSSCDK